MTAHAGAAGKRDALERRRRWGRLRAVFAAFVVGVLLGGGLVQLAVLLTAPPAPPADVDSRPPAIVDVQPGEGQVLTAGTASFRITFDEPLAGSPTVTLVGGTNRTVHEGSFDRRSWRGDVAIAPGDDGPHDLRIEDVHDSAGNRAAPLTYAYAIDTVAPSARVSVSATESSVPFDVSWDADDWNGSGVARVDLWWRADDGPWSLLRTFPDARGTYTVDPGTRRATLDFSATAVDAAGNAEPGTPAGEATVGYDAFPPSAALLAIDAYWFREPVRVSAIEGPNVTAVDLRYHFAPDNATWQGPFSAGVDTTPYDWTFGFPLGPGHYRLHARAEDRDGTWERDQGPAAAEVGLGYDTLPPTTELVPVSPFWRSDSVTLEAQVADDRSGIARVELRYAYRQNGTAPWSAWTVAASSASSPWTFPFDFPRGDGRYAIATHALDAAGNAEALPAPGSADVSVGFDASAPVAPTLLLPTFIDAALRTTNVTWTDAPAPDVVRYEVHRGPDASFTPDGSPCGSGGTCIVGSGRMARAAWISLPTENETYWFRVGAEDDGGLAATSASSGAVFHGRGFDTANAYALATPLPVNVAWSERIEYVSGCVDCVDVFRVSLNALDVLTLRLAVPGSGDFRLLVLDAAFAQAGVSDARGWGAWEFLSVEVLKGGTYYVVVDWGGVTGSGRNEGWYTLGALVTP